MRDRMHRLAQSFADSQLARLASVAGLDAATRTHHAAIVAASLAECARQCRKLDPAIPEDGYPDVFEPLIAEVTQNTTGACEAQTQLMALVPVLAALGAALERPDPVWVGPFAILLAPTSYAGAPVAMWCEGETLRLLMEREEDLPAASVVLPWVADRATIATALAALVAQRSG